VNFYYDLLEDAVEQIQLGGWVMYPLIITSLWMWYLIGRKIVEMYTLTKGDRLAHEIMSDLQKGKKEVPAAPWQKKIIDGYLKERTELKALNENIIDSLRINQEGYIKRYVGTISLLSTIAPLLGLLGTVSGMIKTFSAIAEFGTGNARALAAGISEALITTQTGLIIAVPGLFLASFLIRRSDELMERMRRFCLRLTVIKVEIE
jgi:biopolymer transport protein ExbB